MTTETRPALCYPGFVDGIDVSSVQTIYDAQAIADDGFVYATVKASEGAAYTDPKVLDHLKKLRDVGLICNVYAFLRPGQDPVAEVRKAFDSAGDEFPMRMMFDVEAAADGMSAAAIVAFIEACVAEALRYGVLYPEFYSFGDFVRRRLQPALGLSTVIANCPLQMAQYMSTTSPWVPPFRFNPYVPAPWTTWTKHQYSGNGGYRVRGIYGDCDRSLFNGDHSTFRNYMGLPDDRPTAPMPIVHPTVDLQPIIVSDDEQ